MLQSVMRTGVPFVQLILIQLGVGRLGLPNAVLTEAATVILALVLYLILRLLEQIWPQVGVLLGWIGAPSYGDVVKGEVIKSETLTRDELESALADLRDDFGDLVESKVTSSVAAAVNKGATTGRKSAAKKAASK